MPRQPIDAVLIGSAQAADPVREVHGRVAAVVLAAGGSSRLDSDLPKQVLPWQPGGTLVGRAADIALEAATLGEVVVVTGHRAQQVQAALGDRPVRVVYNPDWQTGQSSSVAAGLSALAPDVSAVVFLSGRSAHGAACDHRPAGRARTARPWRRWLRRSTRAASGAIRCSSTARTFPELLALHGDSGGRPLLQRYGEQVAQVEIDSPLPQGIETMDDYRRVHAG